MKIVRRRLQPDSDKAVDNFFADNLHFSSSALARAAEKLAAECFKPTGLSPSQAAIVDLLLSSEPSAVNPSYLAKSLLLSPSTITRLLQRMEAKGYVHQYEYDGIRMVETGDTTYKLHKLILECSAAFERKCEQLLGSEEFTKLTGQMNKATDILRSGIPARKNTSDAPATDNCPNADENSGPESRPLQGKLYVMPTPEQTHTVEAAYLQKAIDYEAYTDLIDELVTRNQTTGPDQSPAMVHYTVLNQQRMHRWDKTIQLLPSAETAIHAITVPQTWLVLTEAWCGDAAHTIPAFHALASLNPLVTLRFVFRDENPELMDRYLTNGVSRSIPKLIALDTTTREELFTWGPRPAPLQAIFMKLKEEGSDFHAIKEELQRWYNKDRSVTTQQELAALVAATNSDDMGLTA